MNPIQIQLNVSFDSEAVVDLLVRAIEKGTSNAVATTLQAAQQRASQVLSSTPASAQEPPPDNDDSIAEPKLIDVNTVATMLSVSTRMVRRLRDNGGMPKPVMIGRLVRWRSEAIEEWIQAGCPAVERRGVKRRGV